MTTRPLGRCLAETSLGRPTSSSPPALHTADDGLSITDLNGDTVTIELVATQDDGTVRTYRGTYTVQGGRIVKANIRRVS